MPSGLHGRATNTALTVVELLIAVAVVMIIAAFLGAVFVGAKERSKIAADLSNLRKIGSAVAMYAYDYDDRNPLSVVPLINEGRVQSDVCQSPSDGYEGGFLRAFIFDIFHGEVPVDLPDCSYVGPADAMWTWNLFAAQILPNENAGWLVNLVRMQPASDSEGTRRGPYQRLLMDGSIVSRTTGYKNIWIAGSQSDTGLPFTAYFSDKDASWHEVLQ